MSYSSAGTDYTRNPEQSKCEFHPLEKLSRACGRDLMATALEVGRTLGILCLLSAAAQTYIQQNLMQCAISNVRSHFHLEFCDTEKGFARCSPRAPFRFWKSTSHLFSSVSKCSVEKTQKPKTMWNGH